MTFVFNEPQVQVLDTRLNSAADQLETLGNEIATIADTNNLATPTPGLLTRIEDRYRRISAALGVLRDGIDNLDAELIGDLFDLPPQTVQVIIDELEANGNLTFENVLAAIIDPSRIESITDLIPPGEELDPGVDEALARIDAQLLDDLLDGTLNPDDLTDQQVDDLRALAQILSPDTPPEEIAALSREELVDFVQDAFDSAAEQRRRNADLQINGQSTINQIQDLRDEGLTDEEIAAELGLQPDELARVLPLLETLATIDTTPSTEGPPDIDEAFLQGGDPASLTPAERQAFIDQVVVPLLTGERSVAEIRALAGTTEASGFIAGVLRDLADDLDTVGAARGESEAGFLTQRADQLRVAGANIFIRPVPQGGGLDDGGLDDPSFDGGFDDGSGGGEDQVAGATDFSGPLPDRSPPPDDRDKDNEQEEQDDEQNDQDDDGVTVSV